MSNLTTPSSSSGAGRDFEVDVQASFVALMLTSGCAPCLYSWPIVEISLQVKRKGIHTDDLMVVVENPNNKKQQQKLLGQIKLSVSITERDKDFKKVMQDAWNDFENPDVFKKGQDVIALITRALSAADSDVDWLLHQARSKPCDEFFTDVNLLQFSSNNKRKKLNVLRHHLKNANNGENLTNEAFHEFLKHFYLLGYDLGEGRVGVVLSLITSHISQFKRELPGLVWAAICQFTSKRNNHAGTITPSDLPKDLRDVFATKPSSTIPENFITPQVPITDWSRHPDATYLALAVLIGAWNEKNKNDIKTITQFFKIGYDDWLQKAREILHCPGSPLSLKNGIWKVSNRVELWNLLGSRILDQNLDTFKSITVTVLKEPDPAFDLPAEERYAASIHGKVLKYSQELRKGIAEGLAILGTRPGACSYCTQGKAEATCVLAIGEILTDANWILWGSLNRLLPTLAEASPGEFLNAVENALRLKPCPFDDLFSQEGNGIFDEYYIVGLLWALEGLAWDKQYLVRVCDVLAWLTSHDPGGRWANRPSNSLTTILLPWMPQTLASIDKRKRTVQTLLKDWPNIAWNLIIQLLPDQHQSSSGSHKPNWRKTIPDGWEKKNVTNKEYRNQVSFYAELAVDAAAHDTVRLAELIDHFNKLPEKAFDQLIGVLASQTISELPQKKQLLLWDHLTKFTNQHRRFSDAEWALSDELITRIENVAKPLAPIDPFNLYQPLFSNSDVDFYEEAGDWQESHKRLNARREEAMAKIFQQRGVEGIIQFSKSVVSPRQVGLALGVIKDAVIEQTLLPNFLDEDHNKHRALVSGFIWNRYEIKGWEWCDNIDKSVWTTGQIAHFLTCLLFTKETWDRASEWLKDNQGEYWSRTDADAYQADGDLAIAIEKLLKHGRPYSAIKCLDKMRLSKQEINIEQCVRVLLTETSSNETTDTMDVYRIVGLIKFLQSEPSVTQEDLFKVEWAYLQYGGVTPKLLESQLASNPEFFCEVISLIYRSKKEDKPSKEPTEEVKARAKNASRLLEKWKTIPGVQEDGTISAEHFKEWLQQVKTLCMESGHLEVALSRIGKVLFHAPPDPDGLWIHQAVATALNDLDSEKMRNGFSTETYNSRGGYWVDPTGKPEKDLAKNFRCKAEDVENAGFHRFAVTLKDLADGYERDAKRIIDDHQKGDS